MMTVVEACRKELAQTMLEAYPDMFSALRRESRKGTSVKTILEELEQEHPFPLPAEFKNAVVLTYRWMQEHPLPMEGECE
jgi:hypothetical protein